MKTYKLGNRKGRPKGHFMVPMDVIDDVDVLMKDYPGMSLHYATKYIGISTSCYKYRKNYEPS